MKTYKNTILPIFRMRA